ncbi:hypothetical protein D3C87_2174410 [compost metagenome]
MVSPAEAMACSDCLQADAPGSWDGSAAAVQTAGGPGHGRTEAPFAVVYLLRICGDLYR